MCSGFIGDCHLDQALIVFSLQLVRVDRHLQIEWEAVSQILKLWYLNISIYHASFVFPCNYPVCYVCQVQVMLVKILIFTQNFFFHWNVVPLHLTRWESVFIFLIVLPLHEGFTVQRSALQSLVRPTLAGIMGSAFNPQILVEKLAKLNSSQASIESILPMNHIESNVFISLLFSMFKFRHFLVVLTCIVCQVSSCGTN